MIVIQDILEKKATILHQSEIDGVLLQVKETEHYRWLEYGGRSIQSMMEKKSPEKVVMPVCQGLLLFVLFKENNLNVLNLGLGGGTIERALAVFPNMELTSVELSSSIIDVTSHYFSLPSRVRTVCHSAELFINDCMIKYDVILCDLFIGEENPAFLFSPSFYKNLYNATGEEAVISFNFKLSNNQQLLELLLIIRQYFSYIILIEFNDYSNIVLICSKVAIPDEKSMAASLFKNHQLQGLGIDKKLPKMVYIPPYKNKAVP